MYKRKGSSLYIDFYKGVKDNKIELQIAIITIIFSRLYGFRYIFPVLKIEYEIRKYLKRVIVTDKTKNYNPSNKYPFCNMLLIESKV